MTNNGYEKIAYPETYTNEDELHNILKSMRENDPVCWLEPENYRPFWAITKHSDISVSYTHLTLPTIYSV